ncbi:NAD(P)/FAD-dependent oxidoreductase [Olsenella sp. HMSC062G07]|uniref:NAD(P)/FAD-dependent oxidoreductase n=1 Tax=Olsenella sp. HMSC062G07 TaxID=1739330 RepID=UPI0008A390BB|nr:FAD-binding protein [Olsenella sp. HMSC062G07]OFK24755.1 FAD-dependent oxidoreductase [Olsenella sp. HMSC062G07]
MIDVSNVRVELGSLDGSEESERAALRRTVSRKLHLTPDDLASLEPRRRSVDARRKAQHDVHLLFTVRVRLRDGANAEQELLRRLARRQGHDVRLANDRPLRAPRAPRGGLTTRPVVVGAGCAGLFCALTLAEAGLEPLLVEQGYEADRRGRDVRRFVETGELDPRSNIQFGLGGAGAFSDGKLGTGTKSVAHGLILQALVDAGAPHQILWDAKPHVGSDVLPRVVTRLCERIRQAGGEVRFGCRLTELSLAGGRVTAVTLETVSPTGDVARERVLANDVVLACGHSARDVFSLLKERGVALERKTFAMGVRIEHEQRMVDLAQYGPCAGHPALGAAPYKLVSKAGARRAAFSFCMCPGGFVVAAASEPGGVVTNGMSLSDRAGRNANAGLLANVFPDDLAGDDVLAGVALQRRCERAAFEAGGGGYVAPAQLVGDFLDGVASSAGAEVRPTYPRGVAWGSVEGCLPAYVTQALRAAIPQMDRQLRGFASRGAVLTGVETRSSSPVRVTRGPDLQSVSTRGLWPCGEGAGYAGGIMSAATDGIRVARALAEGLGR